MSSYQKYYDLSSSDNDDNDCDSCSSSSSCEDETRKHPCEKNNNDIETIKDALWGRSILHIDVDCFYVQCEELDRGLRDNIQQLDRPLAIGQKHIVVTCNYAARARGVSKLMSKTDAMVVCPDLRIVDGSDLRRYRKHSRRIYQAFRIAVQDTVGGSILTNRGAPLENLLPCKRNAMDEMMADLSTVVDALIAMESEKGKAEVFRLLSSLCSSGSKKNSILNKPYIFGEDVSSSAARIVEDQTGACTSIVFGDAEGSLAGVNHSSRLLAPTRRNVHEDPYSNRHNSEHARRRRYQQTTECRRRMEIAMILAQAICEDIFQRTQFHVSAGISISPMLAKLSVIQKPKTVNLLLPWRSPDLLYFMPLRKLHEIGSRTHRALAEVSFSSKNAKNILVRDLLELPREKIVESLLRMDGNDDSSMCERKCDLILERCKGLDSTLVEDDGGGAPKTVSVEDSFRRGTMTKIEAVQDALEDLCRRLPPLIQDRVAWSREPSRAYPTTIRLTLRMLVNTPAEEPLAPARRKNPYSLTRSKQSSMGTPRGKLLLISKADTGIESKAVRTLRECVKPLFQELICQKEHRMDVTRMNLAVVNFQDVVSKESYAPQLTYNYLSAVSSSQQPNGNPSTEGMNYFLPSQQQLSQDAVSRSQIPASSEQTSAVNTEKVTRTCATPLSSRKWGESPRARSSTERPQQAKKFARTRIDQFFAKKQC